MAFLSPKYNHLISLHLHSSCSRSSRLSPFRLFSPRFLRIGLSVTLLITAPYALTACQSSESKQAQLDSASSPISSTNIEAPTTQVPGSEPSLKLVGEVSKLKLEWATNDAQRQKGLMFRQILPEDAGMMFGYQHIGPTCFWMKNTLIPLSAGFIDKRGVLVQISDMTPLSEAQHCSNQDIAYVLEVNQGWFKRHHISIGDELVELE